MKKNKFALVRAMALVLLLSASLAGCASPTPTSVPTAVPQPTATRAPTAAPTSAPAPTAASSSATASTSSSSASAAPTVAPTQAPTVVLTAVPAAKSPTGSLTVALSTLEAETFMPWNGGGGRTSYLAMIYEYLAYLDPVTGALKPGLATQWEMSADGKKLTLQLRQGVQFQEGYGELTAEDVKYSLERLAAQDSIAGPAGILRTSFASIDAPSPYQVVVNLKVSMPDLLIGYLSDANQALIVSKKYVTTVGDDKANTRPIGSGPYMLAEEHKKGGPIKLTTIPNVEKHWRVVPAYKNVTFLLVPEEATRVAMLKNGEADLAPISYDSIDTIKASNLNVVSIQKSWSPIIRLGGLVATDPKRFKADNPWAKIQVRQALNYAIDKATIAKTIFRGEATPGGSGDPVPPFYDIEPYPYDVAKAKQLLTEAGYPNGFSITLKTFTTVPGAELPTIGEAVALYWKAIGVDVKIVPTDFGTVRGEWTGGKAIDYVWIHRGLAFADPFTAAATEYKDNPFAVFVTPEYSDLFIKSSAEIDPKKRQQLALEYGKLMRDQAANIFLVFANEPYGASKKVGQWPTIRVRPQNIDLITPP
ncbi:MAG: ABC transporter substrate-binding protein [Chloroflexi bacterium]|nr:ABC transporter substrate-binding protein [Chloroflexota bacterium]